MQGQRPWPPAAAGGTLLCLFERRRGSKGEPSPGVPPFILALCTCAPLRWAVVFTPCCDSTPFLWCLPKETVSSRQRKALFLPRRLHHSRERFCLGCRYSSSPDLGQGAGWYLGGCLRRGRTGLVMAALRGWSTSRVSLSLSAYAYHQARFFGAPPRFFAQEQRNGVESVVGGGSFFPRKRRTRTIPRQAPAPCKSRARNV